MARSSEGARKTTHCIPLPCTDITKTVKADSHIPCRSHDVPLPLPCRDLATTLPFSDSAVSFVKVRVVDHAVTLPRPCHEPTVSRRTYHAVDRILWMGMLC